MGRQTAISCWPEDATRFGQDLRCSLTKKYHFGEGLNCCRPFAGWETIIQQILSLDGTMSRKTRPRPGCRPRPVVPGRDAVRVSGTAKCVGDDERAWPSSLHVHAGSRQPTAFSPTGKTGCWPLVVVSRRVGDGVGVWLDEDAGRRSTAKTLMIHPPPCPCLHHNFGAGSIPIHTLMPWLLTKTRPTIRFSSWLHSLPRCNHNAHAFPGWRAFHAFLSSKSEDPPVCCLTIHQCTYPYVCTCLINLCKPTTHAPSKRPNPILTVINKRPSEWK